MDHFSQEMSVKKQLDMNKIYDAFIFSNELDILEIRLNILNDKVDYFVIVEANKTFTGVPKPLFFKENQDRFNKFKDKIIHVVVEDLPNSFRDLEYEGLDPIQISIINDCKTTPNIPKDESQIQWLREFYQRECIKRGISKANDEDFIFVSDLDEIWDPSVHYDFQYDGNMRLNQRVFTYYLNLESSEKWYGTICTKYKNVKNYSVNHLRTLGKNEYVLIENSGWHFTFQGGEEMIRKKLESYGHQEYNNQGIKDDIPNKISNLSDIFNRGFFLNVNNSFLPDYVLNNIEKYSHMIINK